MDSNSLLHDRAGCFDRHAAGQSTIPHLHIAHAHELLWRPSFRVKCLLSLQWTIGNPHSRDWEEHELDCAAALLLSTPQLSSQLSHSTLADITQSCFVVLWTVFITAAKHASSCDPPLSGITWIDLVRENRVSSCNVQSLQTLTSQVIGTKFGQPVGVKDSVFCNKLGHPSPPLLADSMMNCERPVNAVGTLCVPFPLTAL